LVCPVMKFGEEICFLEYVSWFSLIKNFGKKYNASTEMWVGLPCYMTEIRNMCPREMSLSLSLVSPEVGRFKYIFWPINDIYWPKK
jgi:hypothetical protein